VLGLNGSLQTRYQDHAPNRPIGKIVCLLLIEPLCLITAAMLDLLDFGPDSGAGLSPVAGSGLLAIVRVKSVPFRAGNDLEVDAPILDYIEEYQVCGQEFPSKSFRNAEDAVNYVRRIKGYRLLHPAAHSAWLGHRRAIEPASTGGSGKDGVCFAVLHRDVVVSLVPRAAWYRDDEEIPNQIATVSRVVRWDVDPDTYFVVSGLGVDDASGADLSVDNGMIFLDYEAALRYFRGETESRFVEFESTPHWIQVLNEKNRELPLAHYSYERFVLHVGFRTRRSVDAVSSFSR
jgi:hypothetical protein